MLHHNLSPILSTYRAVNATAAGTSEIDGASFDMQATFGGPFQAIRYICALGTATDNHVTSLKIQGSPDNSTWSDIANSQQGPANATGDSNKLLISEVYEPQFRYLRPVVTRGTQNCAVDSVVGEAFQARATPITTQDATVSVPTASHGSATAKPYNLTPQPGVAGTA
jgi:hypothetical protein